MMLSTIKTDCIFEYHPELFDSITDEIAECIDEDISTVNEVLRILKAYKLIEERDNNIMFLEANDNVGSESESAQRVREFREKKALHCNGDVTNCNDIKEEDKEEKQEEKQEDKEQQKADGWAVFLGIISDVIPESKLRNLEKCRELLEMRTEETGLTASEIADCVKDFTHDYKSKGNDPMFFKQLERILGDAYGETIKTYVTKKAREKKKAQREEEKIDYLNLWDDYGEEKSNDFSATWSESWQAFEKVIDRALIPETNVDLVNCTELLEERCNAGYRAELLAVCINEHAEACRKYKLQIKPLAEILGGNLFNGTIAPMYRRKYGQLVTIPADSGNNEEAELPF